MTTGYENQSMYYEKSHRAKKTVLPRIISDHLGSIRVVLTEQGNVDSWSDYYPFGKESRGSSTSNEPKEQFTGKERDIEIGLDYFGARYYNADIGRWTSTDRFGSIYPSLSLYQYTANNPIFFVDINGDSMDVSQVQEKDKSNGTYYMNNIIDDLSEQTGLSYTITPGGQLTYATDDQGNAIISKDANGNEIGSASARNLMINAISTKKQAFVQVTSGNSKATGVGSPLIKLGAQQIEGFISGTSSDLNSKTLGWGMTFMHETLHSNVGISKGDPIMYGSTGAVVDRMNIIRAELDKQGTNGLPFGERASYHGRLVDGIKYIPFSSGAKMLLDNKLKPQKSYVIEK